MRVEVLDTVERLLQAGEGFTTLGVNRISEQAGVSRSAFYLNFADKSDLLMQLTAQASEEIFQASAAWIESVPREGMEALVRTQLNSLGVFRAHAAVLAAYAEVAAYDPVVAELWRSRIEELVSALEQRIAEGQERGEIRSELAPAATAGFIVWGAERVMSQHVAGQPATADAGLARDMAEAVWALLYG